MVVLPQVVDRLVALGATDVITANAAFALTHAEALLAADLNVSVMPAELDSVLILRACGHYFELQHVSNTLSAEEAESVVKSIKEGDTTVDFDVSAETDARRAHRSYAQALMQSGKDQLGRYRRLAW